MEKRRKNISLSEDNTNVSFFILPLTLARSFHSYVNNTVDFDGNYIYIYIYIYIILRMCNKNSQYEIKCIYWTLVCETQARIGMRSENRIQYKNLIVNSIHNAAKTE